MKKLLLLLALSVCVFSMKLKKKENLEKTISLGDQKIILNLKVNEYECCNVNNEKNGTDLPELDLESEPQPGPEPKPELEPEPKIESEPEPKPEPQPKSEICPGAPLQIGTYEIKTTDGEFSWDFSSEKLVLNEPADDDTQKFTLSFADDCNYFISNQGKYVQSYSACKTLSETHQVTHETSQPLDVLFIIDATLSMSGTLNKVRDYSIEVAEILSRDLAEYSIMYGAIYYRDPLGEGNEDYPHVLDFTDDIKGFQEFASKQTTGDGGDHPEDWNGAYKEALKLKWRDGVKLIIHITDAPAHGNVYGASNDKLGEKEAEIAGMDQNVLDLCDMKSIYIKGLSVGEPEEKEEDSRKIKILKGLISSLGSPKKSWERMTDLCRAHREEKGEESPIDLVEIKKFDQDSPDKQYFIDMIVSTTKETISDYKEVCKSVLVAQPTVDTDSEKWEIVKNGDYYSFKSLDGKYIQIEDGLKNKMTPLIIDTSKGDDNEKFFVSEVPLE